MRRLIFRLLGLLVVIGLLGVWWVYLGASRHEVPDTPELQASLAQGEALFGRHCSACHGAKAAGSEKGPPLIDAYYRPDNHGDLLFIKAVQDGVGQHHWKFGDMPPIEGLSVPQISHIIHYVRALQRANGIY